MLVYDSSRACRSTPLEKSYPLTGTDPSGISSEACSTAAAATFGTDVAIAVHNLFTAFLSKIDTMRYLYGTIYIFNLVFL